MLGCGCDLEGATKRKPKIMNTVNTDAILFEGLSKVKVVGQTTLNGLPGMTSLEIAEITKKSHKHVLRDIAKLVEVLESRSPDLDRQIVRTQYVDSRGKLQPLTILDKRRTFVLLSRYSFELSDLIVGRWLELEGSGFARVPVKESIVHLVEREKDNRAAAFAQRKRRPPRNLTKSEREAERCIQRAAYHRNKEIQGGNWKLLADGY